MNSIDKLIDKNNIKKLNNANSAETCNKIRQFLIDSVTKNGGHLASNLGVVELTLAMHKVFDFPKDKVVFDVGHQSYVHKMLSGRCDKFSTLRKLDGLSGFPKTDESEYDCFNTGHSSTSISAALGIARARDLNNEDYNVIAFIGDGALGGGMAFEALDDVGATKTRLIIVLNDNEMSINQNVGGLSAHLSMLRANKSYLSAKNRMHDFLDKVGILGKAITKILKTVKKAIKFATVASPMFEELGIKYIGIIDGHDIDELTSAFEKAKNINGPVIIHTLTKKGMGYQPAEENPDLYHGISAYTNKNTETCCKQSYTATFGRYISQKAETNEKIVAITAAMCAGCGLTDFSQKFVQRFYDVGIAEQHAVTLAAGLASRGLIPVFSVYSTFLQRGYDQILHDVCLQNLHVVFAIDRSGVVGEDGETHQGVFDFSYLLHLPNMTVLAPSCKEEFEQMLDYAIDECNGPVAVRYPKAAASERDYNKFNYKQYELVSDGGNEIVLLSVGRMLEIAIDVQAKLKLMGLNSKVLNIGTVKPLNEKALDEIVGQAVIVATIEDNQISGGAGQYIASRISRANRSKLLHFGYDDCFVCQGTQAQLIERYGLSSDAISKKIKEELNDNE